MSADRQALVAPACRSGGQRRNVIRECWRDISLAGFRAGDFIYLRLCLYLNVAAPSSAPSGAFAEQFSSHLAGAAAAGKYLAAQSNTRPPSLDLRRPAELARVADPELFLARHAAHLVNLDKIQRVTELFPVLRSLVDEQRRAGRFLLLG